MAARAGLRPPLRDWRVVTPGLDGQDAAWSLCLPVFLRLHALTPIVRGMSWQVLVRLLLRLALAVARIAQAWLRPRG